MQLPKSACMRAHLALVDDDLLRCSEVGSLRCLDLLLDVAHLPKDHRDVLFCSRACMQHRACSSHKRYHQNTPSR